MLKMASQRGRRREETGGIPSGAHGATNKEHQVCARRRVVRRLGLRGGSERCENAAWEDTRPGPLGSGGWEERLFSVLLAEYHVMAVDQQGLLARLVRELVRLPGIGQKTAQRLAFHILKAERDDALRLAEAIRAVKDGLSFCRQCRNIAEGELCEYCLDPKRDQTRILVVEEPSTTYAIERAGAYRGLYHVLLGALSPLDGVGPSDIKAEQLIDRVKLGGVEEVILATSPTIEGEATAIYLTNQLKPLGVRVSRIAYGIPVGMDIEYADDVTLLKSIEGRRDL